MPREHIKTKDLQLRDILKDELNTGKYAVKLPTVRQLSKKYGISINIVRKTIQLLKEEGLVSVKERGGIFPVHRKMSQSAQINDIPFRFNYTGAVKKIKIHFEDELSWQKNYWTKVLREHNSSNPDIELEFSFGLKEIRKSAKPDILISGIKFFNHAGFTISDLVEYKYIKSFFPDMYSGKILSPQDLEWNEKQCIYPLFFQVPVILCKKNKALNLESLKPVDFPDYVMKLKQKKGANLKYFILDIIVSLIDSGCTLWDERKGIFKFNDEGLWRKELKVIKKLFKENCVKWYCGKSIGENFSYNIENDDHFVEVPLNLLHHPEVSDNLQFSLYPYKNIFPMGPICGFIMNHSRYVEECLRIIEIFLRKEPQAKFLNEKFGFPIDIDVLKNNGFNDFVYNVEQCSKQYVIPPDTRLHHFVDEIIIWEILSYLKSMDGYDVIEKIKNKALWYLKP